jgi:hypothetical protein
MIAVLDYSQLFILILKINIVNLPKWANKMWDTGCTKKRLLKKLQNS